MPRVTFPTDLGRCAVTWNEAGLTRFELPGATAIEPGLSDVPPGIAQLIARVRDHFSGRLQDFADVDYDYAQVSAFQRLVYEHALTVKAGRTESYGEVARALALPPGGARSIGAALGRNPWPLLVPCHRFIGADGKMTGFSAPGGIKTKLRLLALEGAQLFPD